MLRLLLTLMFLANSSTVQSSSEPTLYQIDLAIYTYPSLYPYIYTPAKPRMLSDSPIPLKVSSPSTSAEKNIPLYHLLPFAHSQLQQAEKILKNATGYQLVLNYSWVQSITNQKPILVEKIQSNDWKIEGKISIKKIHDYLLEADLLFSAAENKIIFPFQQKRYLKENKLYYLDHPQAGILVKIHPILD